MSTPAERAEAIAALPLVPAGRSGEGRSGFVGAVREMWDRRELVMLLARREVRARYKDSTLGLAWSLFRPLAQLLVYYFAIGKVLGVARDIPNFAIFVFIGLSAWSFYGELMINATRSIVVNGGLVKKVYLPREVFVLASMGAALFNYAVQVVVLLVAMITFQQIPDAGGLGYALGGFAVIAVFGLALGLVLAALNVYYRDIEHFVDVAFIVLFWASPIVYSFAFVNKFLDGSWLETLYVANPVTIAILGLQRGLWKAGDEIPGAAVWPAGLGWWIAGAFVVSLFLLWAAQRVFSRLQGNFAQEV